MDYFKSEWLDTNYLASWYEGYAPCYPSTTNSIESINALIKKFITRRLKLPIEQFLQISVPSLVQNWSLSAIDKYNKLPNIKLSDFTNASQ